MARSHRPLTGGLRHGLPLRARAQQASERHESSPGNEVAALALADEHLGAVVRPVGTAQTGQRVTVSHCFQHRAGYCPRLTRVVFPARSLRDDRIAAFGVRTAAFARYAGIKQIGAEITPPHAARFLHDAIQPFHAVTLPEVWCASDITGQNVDAAADAHHERKDIRWRHGERQAMKRSLRGVGMPTNRAVKVAPRGSPR